MSLDTGATCERPILLFSSLPNLNPGMPNVTFTVSALDRLDARVVGKLDFGLGEEILETHPIDVDIEDGYGSLHFPICFDVPGPDCVALGDNPICIEGIWFRFHVDAVLPTEDTTSVVTPYCLELADQTGPWSDLGCYGLQGGPVCPDGPGFWPVTIRCPVP